MNALRLGLVGGGFLVLLYGVIFDKRGVPLIGALIQFTGVWM